MEPKKYSIRAYYLAKIMPLSEVEKRNELALFSRRRNFLVFQPAHDKTLVVFSFGVVVLFNYEEKEGQKIVRQLAKYGIDRLEKPKTEEYGIVLDPEKKPSVEFDHAILNRVTPEHVHLVAEILAQSVAIDFVEERVDEIAKKFEEIHAALEKTGSVHLRDVEVRKRIGAGRGIIQYVVSQLSLLDKPDVTWENKEYETLYDGMRRMFELEDRFSAMKFRLEFIQDTSELILGILHNRRAVRLELAIVILFVIDIILVLYEAFFK